VVRELGGSVLVADEDAGPAGSGAVIRVDPSYGSQQMVADGNNSEARTGLMSSRAERSSSPTSPPSVAAAESSGSTR